MNHTHHSAPTAEALEPKWFCIRSHPKHEHIAAAQLTQVAGVEVFNPQLRLERMTRRGRVRSTESLFTSYLFARFVLESSLERVRYTPSVKSVLQFGPRIGIVSDEVISDLRRTLAENADTFFTEAPLEGDEAEIGIGPFQGEKGIVTRVLPARQRVEILLEVMGRSLPAQFNLSSLLFNRRPIAHQLLPVVSSEETQVIVTAVP